MHDSSVGVIASGPAVRTTFDGFKFHLVIPKIAVDANIEKLFKKVDNIY